MALPAILAGAAVAGPIIGGILGQQAAKGDKKAAQKAMKAALGELNNLGYPPDLSKEIIVQELQRQGVYTPQLEQDLSDQFAESEMAKIKPNEALSREQLSSIEGLKMLSKTGLGAEDRAAINEIRSRLRQDEKAKTAQLLQTLQSQGMGGSGAALMAQLGASQQAANLASQEADQTMAQASSARRQALLQLGQQSGEMQQQEFNRQSQIASAMDERNRFLQQNSIARQSANVNRLNEAQAADIAEKQRLHEQNILNKRSEQLRQADASNQYWQNKQNLAVAKANALTGQASNLQQQAANTASSYGQMGAGIGTAAGALGSAKSDSVFGKWMSGSAEEGGIVGDPKTAGGATAGSDNVNMNLREGEMVLNAEQQGALFDFLKRIGNKFPKD